MSLDLKYGSTQLEHFHRPLLFLRNLNMAFLKLVRLVRVPCGLRPQRRLFVVVSWQYPFRAHVSAGVCVLWSADRCPCFESQNIIWPPKKLRAPQRRQFIYLRRFALLLRLLSAIMVLFGQTSLYFTKVKSIWNINKRWVLTLMFNQGHQARVQTGKT